MAKFLTFEGIEGVGKSEAVRYVASLLQARGVPFVATREPGGTKIAEEIRRVLLHSVSDEVMASDTELLLMFASRAQHVAQLIRPALAQGNYVLCDRFTDSSYAYQGGGRGIAMERIARLDAWVNVTPDITILLDAPVALAMQRASQRSHPDRIEKETLQFFECVREAFLQRAAASPLRYRIIDASQDLVYVQSALKQVIEEVMA